MPSGICDVREGEGGGGREGGREETFGIRKSVEPRQP